MTPTAFFMISFWSGRVTDEMSHLFNDDMFPMIVQPDRHFRGETKLPEKDRGKDGEIINQ